MKRCLKCGAVKAIAEFSPRKSGSRDGYHCWCHACMRVAVRRSYYKRRATGWKRIPRPQDRYIIYREGALRRGLGFSLTFTQFMSIWGQPCVYCGGAIEQIGIDRIDNDEGYTPDNVVPCCGICNTWKHSMTVDEFRRHVQRVYRHLILGERTDGEAPVNWQAKLTQKSRKGVVQS